jgi:hypothetical protein
MKVVGTLARGLALTIGIALTQVAVPSGPADAAMVKQSNSGICHDEGSAWYGRTKNFTAYGSMSECLGSGRAYKGYSGVSQAMSKSPTATVQRGGTAMPYDRDLYDHWIDEDGDCQNARHELLQDLSTGQITLSSSGCTVVQGRWNDPYTGKIFTRARAMDIDHMVPLAWAHAHGADKWDSATRRKFANDPMNLFAVEASANRSKGAKGPLEWLPPNEAFHCQYVARFQRIVLTYKLKFSDYEAGRMDALRARVCS